MKYETFKKNKINHIKEPMFLGQGQNVARYDQQKHPFFERLIDKQYSFFWRPEEIGLDKDQRDWQKLNVAEKHIFISNLKRQILLDSVQGRSPNMAFLPIVGIPELETWVETWAGNETLHSRSYTHIIRNLFNEPDKIFDTIMDNELIIKAATQMTEHYDDLIDYNHLYIIYGYGTHNHKGKEITLSRKEHLKKIYLAIASVNILEGIRFYVSFACAWAFNERDLLEGNSKIITLICRDENLHLSGTQYMLNSFAEEYADVGGYELVEELKPMVEKMFDYAVEDEKKWAEYLFQHDSMLGLNTKILHQFIEYIANTRLMAINLEPRYKTTENPIDWVNKYIGSVGRNNVQVAPQESEITSYLIGQFDNDLGEDTFSDFNLDKL